MPVKRTADTPPRARKRPRVPKCNDGNEEEGNARAEPAEEEEDDLQDEVIEEEGGYYVEDIYIPPKLSLTERPLRGERLIIEKIECENFKSYGGVKTMGPFHKSFSAIIGPNGNGKSNIIDAMLFVFGYRAKKIRCKKVSVLIHKSDLLPNVGSCAVTVHFLKIQDDQDDDENELKIVPNSRITVCRRAYTNNSSAYWLNNKRVQFTDVAKFLKENGIDIVHNRFLILQGEVEQIAQMPPKATNTHETGFLEFIDEVIGTKRYEKALFLLKERIGLLEVQREEKTQRVQLAEQHKDGLREPMEKAKVYLNNKNVMTRTNHTLNQVKAFKYRQRVAEKAEKLKELETTREGIVTRLLEIKQYNDEKRKEYIEAEKAFKAAEAKFQAKKKALDEADGKFTQLNREMKASNDERKQKMKDLENTSSELEKLEGLPERHNVEIGKLEKRKKDLDEEIRKEEESTKGAVERLNEQVDACVTEKTNVDAEFRKWKSLMNEKEAARNTLQKELDRGKSNEEAEKEKLQKLEEELKKLEESSRRKSETGLTVQPNAIPKLEAEAQKKREKANELANQEYEKRAIYQNLRAQFNNAKDSLDGGQMSDRVDKALFAEKAKGLFPGLYGRFKDLATIDEKYNIAATVATNMTKFWIVDNDATGAECIQYLKDHGLPAQTFVCINKMGSLKDRCRQQFRTPKDSLRIFDLLKISKPELAPVFYKGFFDTLVAEDLDIATRVAYGGSTRHRVVSCQGDIVETTGSLVGGGTRPPKGDFNTEMAKRLNKPTMSKKQIDDLQAKCDAAEMELTNVSDRRKALEEEANNLEKEIQEIKVKVSTYHSDLEAAKKMIPLKIKQVKDQEQKVKDSAIPKNIFQEKMKRIQSIDSEIEKAREPFENAQENANRLAEKLKSLQQNKRKEILKKLTTMTDQRKRVIEEINKLNVELRNCERNKKKLEAKLEKLTEDKKSLEAKMLEMNKERQELQSLAEEINKEQAPLEEDRNQKEQIYTELKNKASEFDQEEKQLNKQKVTIENSFQTLSDEVRSLEKQEKILIASLEKFKLEDIPEVEVDPFELLSEEDLNRANEKDLEARLHKYQQKLQRAEPNLNILPEYANACQILLQRYAELEEVNTRRDKVNTGYLELEARRMKEFMEGYASISAKVKELFRMISMGGDAELDLLDSTDPFSCGIDFSVRPRGKTWKKIINLSGGEKTLSSLALVFSLHHFKPSPFYVMDEIDAALDFQNVSIIANYIKDRTKFTQFIIISLRSNMFELADSLLGVYKVDNMSYSIRIGVSKVVNSLRGIYEQNGRPFLLGHDDQITASSSRRIQTATTQSSQAQTQATIASTAQPNVAASDKRPSFDVSAIQEPGDVSGTETERLSGGSRPPSSHTDYNPGTGAADTESGSSGEAKNPVRQEEKREDCESPELFNDSFEAGNEPPPKFSSTPLVTSPPKRLRTKGNLVQVGEEPAEESTDEDMDDSEASEFFESLSGSQKQLDEK